MQGWNTMGRRSSYSRHSDFMCVCGDNLSTLCPPALIGTMALLLLSGIAGTMITAGGRLLLPFYCNCSLMWAAERGGYLLRADPFSVRHPLKWGQTTLFPVSLIMRHIIWPLMGKRSSYLHSKVANPLEVCLKCKLASELPSIHNSFKKPQSYQPFSCNSFLPWSHTGPLS